MLNKITKYSVIIGLILLLSCSKGTTKTTTGEDHHQQSAPEKMMYLEEGNFEMGDTSGEGTNNEKPLHTVKVNSFYIGKYEVTQKEWVEIMLTNPSNYKGDNLPVEQVSWYDAVEFCNKKSLKEGLKPAYAINGTNVTWDRTANGYRLPTESEWEYAARGGQKSKGYKFSGSNEVNPIGWCTDNTNDKGTQPVGTKEANELGLYDMSGNVWEWCWDWYGNYSPDSLDNPQGPDTGFTRVYRGGSWGNYPRELRVSARGYIDPPTKRGDYLGFRVARNL